MLKHLWLTGVLLTFLTAALSLPTQAAEPHNNEIRILVDISGSMKQTDPNNLRIPAVNLLTELIPEGSQAGIWTFGQYVNPLLKIAKVDPAWRQQAKSKAKEINSAGLFTNLPGVLESASLGLQKKEGHETNIILLTDGYIDMPDGRNAEHRQRLIQNILPLYVKTGAKIHTLALSNDVDKELLKEISAATQGLFLEAHTSDELMRAFLKAFDRAVPTEQVPLHNNQFNIDSSVNEFTALIFRSANGHTQLITPSGQRFDSASALQNKNVHWHHDIGFELITVKAPEPGRWAVDAEQDPDNRVQVLSDLKLMVQGIPAALFAGMPVTMQTALTEGNEVVRIAEVLRTTDFNLTVTAPDGRVGQKRLSDKEHIPASGLYLEEFTRLNVEGEYQFDITAVGKTFERKQRIIANLIAPLKLTTQKILEKEQLVVFVTPDESVDPTFTRIHISVTAANGQSEVHEIPFDKQSQTWSYRVSADKGPGRYALDVSGRVVLNSQAKMNYRPGTVNVSFPLALAADATPAEAPIIHKEAQVVEAVANANELGLPDLAAEYQKQQQALQKQQPEEEEPLVLEDEESSSTLWLYIVIAVVAVVAISAAVFIVLRSKKAPAAPEPVESEPKEEAEAAPAPAPEEIPEDLIQESIEEPEEELPDPGDFDDFDGDEEVEIPMPQLEPIDELDDPFADLDKDFSIDPDDAKN